MVIKMNPYDDDFVPAGTSKTPLFAPKKVIVETTKITA